jgi:hypothetical protein
VPDGPVPAPGEANLGATEAYLGVGCALAALGDPRAEPTLRRAIVLTEDVGLMPSPWQRDRVERALVAVGSTGRTAVS